MIKDEIREDMRAKRRALSKDEVKIKSDEIRQRLLGVERVKQAKTICTFISAFKEPDTVEIIKELWEQDKKIVVPITDIENGTLSLSYINSMDDMKKGAYGILEPKKSCALVTAADIDFAVVPCLSFDRKGRRLGQGGGYYDRLLPQLHCPTVLICREQLMSPEVPVEEHDMRCTMLVTEKGVLTPEA